MRVLLYVLVPLLALVELAAIAACGSFWADTPPATLTDQVAIEQPDLAPVAGQKPRTLDAGHDCGAVTIGVDLSRCRWVEVDAGEWRCGSAGDGAP